MKSPISILYGAVPKLQTWMTTKIGRQSFFILLSLILQLTCTVSFVRVAEMHDNKHASIPCWEPIQVCQLLIDIFNPASYH